MVKNVKRCKVGVQPDVMKVYESLESFARNAGNIL